MAVDIEIWLKEHVTLQTKMVRFIREVWINGADVNDPHLPVKCGFEGSGKSRVLYLLRKHPELGVPPSLQHLINERGRGFVRKGRPILLSYEKNNRPIYNEKARLEMSDMEHLLYSMYCSKYSLNEIEAEFGKSYSWVYAKLKLIREKYPHIYHSKKTKKAVV